MDTLVLIRLISMHKTQYHGEWERCQYERYIYMFGNLSTLVSQIQCDHCEWDCAVNCNS